MNEKNHNLQLCSLQEAAEFLKVSVRGVYRLFESGVLPCVKVGNLNRVRLTDLESYIQRQTSKNEVLA